MAFGFPASYSHEINIVGSRNDAREAIRYVLGLLGWKFESPDPDTYIASLSMNALSWGEKITISLVRPDFLSIESKCSFPFQLFDWGKNRSNVRQFVSIFEPKAVRDAKLQIGQLTNFDEEGKTPLERALTSDTDSEIAENIAEKNDVEFSLKRTNV